MSGWSCPFLPCWPVVNTRPALPPASSPPPQVGDTLDVKGPLPKLPLAEIAKRRAVGLIAGGSGLTPMLQVAEEALRQKLPVQVCTRVPVAVDVQCWECNAGWLLHGWLYAEREGCRCECGGCIGASWAPQSGCRQLRLSPCLQLSFIFANVSEQDIIAKVRGGVVRCRCAVASTVAFWPLLNQISFVQDRLDALAAKHPNFKIHYIVDKSDNKAWKGR